MRAQASQPLTGALVLAEFVDPRRAPVSDQALNAAEVERLSLHASAGSGQMLELSGRTLLCFFPQAGKALDCAREIQALTAAVRSAQPARNTLTARVIIGYGQLALAGGRPRGDWPQRLTELMSRVPAHCIAALKTCIAQLPAAALKTPPQALGGDLLLLQPAEAAAVETRMPASPVADAGLFTTITLRVRGVPQDFRAADCPIVIGRDPRCAVPIAADTASRTHGRIEYRQGKFYYVDVSRNGSWVLIGSGEEIHLTKDRIVLAGEGAISPGAPLAQQSGDVLRYSCLSTRPPMPRSASDGDARAMDRIM